MVMNEELRTRLEMLSQDYERVVGESFAHFVCPMLYHDEDTELCKGHIVPAAFRASDRRWTVQRKDVDSFFGRNFEADFLAIQERGKHDPADVLVDKQLSRQLQPKIVVDGSEVEYFHPTGEVPSRFSEIEMRRDRKRPVRLALKMEPSELLTRRLGDWQIRIEKDVRVPALVTLLRSAHLTMFDMLGYQYALSSSGRFLGDELGKLYLLNRNKRRNTVQVNAARHFAQCLNLVRPIVSATAFQGTVSDQLLFLCMCREGPWAQLTLVRTGEMMHAVAIPIIEDAECVARFVSFLTSREAQHLDVRVTQFVGDHWLVEKQSKAFIWPAANFE
jgi:hypothetical protein